MMQAGEGRKGVKAVVARVGRFLSIALLCSGAPAVAQQTRQGRVVTAGQTGQGEAALTDKAIGRISTRVGNRVQSRVNSRVGRGDPSQTSVLSSFNYAEDQVRRAGRSGRR